LSTSDIIEVDSLLAPISESAPAGVDLRNDLSAGSPYYQLKDARSAARSAERRADSDGASTGGLAAEWQTILSVAPETLARRSKDLEVVTWLTEALVRADGFSGLRTGLALARGLIERFWDSFYSLEDEEGLATRLAPIAGLVGAESILVQPLRKIPLTASGLNDGPFAVYHYEQARTLSQLAPDVRARREAAGEVNLERFRAALTASGGPFYMKLLADIDGALTELRQLSNELDLRAGNHTPSVSDIANVLSTIQGIVLSESKDLVAALASNPSNETDTAVGQSETAGHPTSAVAFGTAGALRDRNDALHVLTQVADFFRKQEPHSPISASLDEIVRRARLPFSELLAELLPDTASWRSALTSAGIKPPAENV
jgi:type VI secretion system protein ImpA